MTDASRLALAVLASAGGTLVGIRVLLGRSMAAFEEVGHRIDGGAFTPGAVGGLLLPGIRRVSQALRDAGLALQAHQEDLKASEDRFRQIAETITEAFWIAEVDIQTTIYISPAYEKIWGRSCASLYENPRSFLEAIHPDDRQRVVAGLEAQQRGEPFDHEYRIRRPDGTERWIWDRGYPVSNGGRRVVQYIGVAQDVTERVRMERVRRETEAHMRFALQAARVGVWDADIRTGTCYWSDTCEVIHGLLPGTFAGTHDAFLDRVHADDREGVRREIELAVAANRHAKFEYRTEWPDGSLHWIVSSARFFRDEAGVPLRAAGISVDVSEQRALEEQLRHAQRVEAIGQFAGGIAHDFNNVLAAILGNADVMLHTLPSDDARRADVDEIAKAASRGTALTRQLLAFSRKEPLAPSVCRVGDVVKELAPMLRRLLDKGIDVTMALGESGRIRAHVTRLEQVLVNLVVNARDAMPAGGCLSIETADVTVDAVESSPGPSVVGQGRYVRVAVRDTGHGMDRPTLDRIFEPFFTTKAQATGLGLSTVSQIVQQGGGAIHVHSDVGRGTRVEVLWPAVDLPQ